MLDHQSTVSSLIRFAVVVVLFLVGARATLAQTSGPVGKKTKMETSLTLPTPGAVVTPATVTASAKAEPRSYTTTATTSVADPAMPEPSAIKAGDGVPKKRTRNSRRRTKSTAKPAASVPASVSTPDAVSAPPSQSVTETAASLTPAPPSGSVTASADAPSAPGVTPGPPPAQCVREIKADVVAIAQPFMLNRLGAAMPNGMIFALKRDTAGGLGKQLRTDKRARPLVLRANVGDCLKITFTNNIPPSKFVVPAPPPPPPGQPYNTSEVSLHVQGMEWVTGPQDDGSFVGKNNSSLATPSPVPSPAPSGTTWPSQTQTYTLFAKAEGTYLIYTMGDTSSTGNQLVQGLFGALNVQPAGAEWYRSQVTQKDLKLVTKGTTASGHPIIDYTKVYPAGSTYPDGTPIPPDTPVLNMLDSNLNIVHTDLTAIITGPNAGRFTQPEVNCDAALPNVPASVNPLFCKNPAAPDRRQPYREFTIIYHGALGAVATQAFPVLSNSSPVSQTTQAGQDAFAINYGTGGIGAEIYANRIGVGPMGSCVDCKFEEFFLSAWSVGDPAMVVDVPANANILAPLPPTPAAPTIPPPPPLCTAAQLGDANPPTAPNPNCVGAKQLTGAARTGTVTFSNGSATVTGAGTKFTTELVVGDILALVASPTTVRGTVKTITNDTKLVLQANAAANANGAYSVATPYKLTGLAKATRAYYPDDPSNVYHSYINDHTKFRILHGGRDVTHVHHQHAHQWLQSPNSDESSYLDSQMISPGASYTLEMVYNGSGNRNKVVGDSIFHCHFYPHFAAGMWAMWRTHDVFEAGSELQNGIPIKGTRALPDGEIIAGTPTPAIVPLPTLPMAPLPSPVFIDKGQIVYGTPATPDVTGANVTVNPGFPFFIPGIAGSRPPHPPLDFACKTDAAGNCMKDAGGNIIYLNGGLPRHVVSGGTVSYESHDKFDWSKDLATMTAIQLPEDGTPVEKVAMKFFGKRCYATFFPDGTPGSCPSSNSTPPQSTLITPPTGFILNGLPLGPQPGAPFADPAVDDNGNAAGTKRIYKAAAIQADVTFNKKGWHYPQQRMLTLWKDVQPTIDFTLGRPGRQPEPLFFRGNSGDIIEYWHTNLVPNYYLVDDFQVRTPTDILGQHIHLVKFDVTSSDGAGNGFNYEDGTFAPQEVQEMIHAINADGGMLVNGVKTPLLDPADPQYKALHAPPTDIFNCVTNPSALRCQPCPPNATPTNRPQCLSWLGAQTTIQRWYLDPQVDDAGVDRTLRTVFTHDHFGPSTHQQAGLYAGLLVEPLDSKWTSNDGAEIFGDRSDGGPTSWQARILTKNSADSYREFMFEFQDLQLAYFSSSTAPQEPSANPKQGWIQANAINAPSTPSLVTTGVAATPPGTYSVNYTNEPVGIRLAPPNAFTPPSKMIDMSYVFDNSVQEALNALLPPGQQNLKVKPDPMTPLMRAYQNDNIQVRVLVGAHVFPHQFNFQGPNWFAEPSWKNSGYRSAQAMGLSEHFEFLFKVPPSSAPNTARQCPDKMSTANCVDYLYSPSFDQFGLANGLWGLFRSYDPTTKVIDPTTTPPKTLVEPLPNNPLGPVNVTYATCPAVLTPPAVKRVFNITAVTAQTALPTGNLVFNDSISSNLLQNDLGIMYVRSEDLDNTGKLKDGVPIEPLVLRANAGDCIEVNLTNKIAANSKVLNTTFNLVPPLDNPYKASSYVGLHPQLLAYDPAKSSGVNVGWNTQNQAVPTDQAVTVGNTIKYQWYAGKVGLAADGSLTYTPVEFGSLNLFPSDLMFQNPNGLFGSMIIEPEGSTWTCGEASNPRSCDPPPPPPPGAPQVPPPTSRTSATVTVPNQGTFREFSLMISDAIRINGDNNAGAVNYRSEPWTFRYTNNLTGDFSCMLSTQLQTAQKNPPATFGDPTPKTPIFTAEPGDSVRFRLTHPMGTGISQVFSLHGHVWQRNPYNTNSTKIGSNSLSQWIGSRDNHGSSDHFDLVIDKAGGEGKLPGDYLYTVFVPAQAKNGAWGIFRVGGGPQGAAVPNPGCRAIPKPNYAPSPPNDDLKRFQIPTLNSKKP